MDSNPFRAEHERMQQEARKPRSDHVEAAKAALMRFHAALDAGRSPEDLGPDLVLLGRLLARRT